MNDFFVLTNFPDTDLLPCNHRQQHPLWLHRKQTIPLLRRRQMSIAEFHMEQDGPTRSATMPLKPFAISKEHVGPRHLFSKPVLPSKTIPVFDLKQKAKSVTWTSPKLNKVPRYYPLERINRRITLEESPLNDILSRMSDGFRVMSVQAKYFNRPVSVCHVEEQQVLLLR